VLNRTTYCILKNSNSIKRIIKSNQKSVSFSHIIFYEQTKDNGITIAFIAPKKMGKAVKRNFAKRRLKAIFRNIFSQYPFSGFNLILMANTKLLNSNFSYLQNELMLNFRKLKIIND
jgi:ribonuclease P protein component